MQQDVLVGDVETLSRRFSRLNPVVMAELLAAVQPVLTELQAIARKLETASSGRPPMAAGEFLTVSQVAERTHASHNLVRRWITSGKLRASLWGDSRRYRVHSTDLEKFLRGESQWIEVPR